MKPTFLLVFLVISVSVPDRVGADEAPIDVATARLNALRIAAKCTDKASPWRPWCIAADFDHGTAADLPKGKVLLGMTVELAVGYDVATAMASKVTLTALTVRGDGKVKVTIVKPETKDEEMTVASAIANLSAVFKGKATMAKLKKDVGDYLKTLKGSYAPTKSGTQWTWAGQSASRLRKVGPFWVVIEVPKAENGIFATILTEAWE